METHIFFPLIISCLLFLYCVLRIPEQQPKPPSKEARGMSDRRLHISIKSHRKRLTSSETSGEIDRSCLSVRFGFGKVCLCWFGTTPRLIIQDPELMKEVLSNKLGHFGGPPVNQLILILTRGLTTLEGEEWAQHRRIINPAFHLEKLKGMIPDFATSCDLLIEKWTKSIVQTGACETDVWLEFQDLTGDIISRTAFGSNFEEGKKILQLQKELQVLVIEAMQTLYIPGFRNIHLDKFYRPP
ncbi:cytochrome P450, family 72, subfamily A, polypeptide 15 [Actinidia rufa]|uniref:Cytochrome P450, family 72, subfamily A, polypeptide 15 n=1 Tax=Actinidia rufa TaxID=165716 RepID=A0A7J0DVE4_9ERIC|nr:cytochrome P450, family 72, subfamily A, polypeptide 15 [Actinidia rufa]